MNYEIEANKIINALKERIADLEYELIVLRLLYQESNVEKEDTKSITSRYQERVIDNE